MIAKKHITPDKRLLLAVCDTEILGKVFTEGEQQLDITKSFYGGEEVDDAGLSTLMEKAYILNLAGEKSVGAAISRGLVSENRIGKIQGVPFAQVITIPNES